MTRSITIHPASLALGLVLAAVCMVGSSQMPPGGDTWPPAKRNIVNISEALQAPVTIPSNGSVVVYSVPRDRWLTVTGTDTFPTGSGGGQWAEDQGGTITRKGYHGDPSGFIVADGLKISPRGCGGPVGWTFRPGSNVVIYNANPNPMIVAGWELVGYLARE